MSEEAPCKLCNTPPEEKMRSGHFRGFHQKCPRCGEFKLTDEAEVMLDRCDVAVRAKISGWVSDQNREGMVPTIREDMLQQFRLVPFRPLSKGRIACCLRRCGGIINWVVRSTLTNQDLLRQHIHRILVKFYFLRIC